MHARHNFKRIGELVRVSGKPQNNKVLQELAAHRWVEVREIKDAYSREEVTNNPSLRSNHPQLIKVSLPGESKTTDWISGGWFVPAIPLFFPN